MKIQHIKDLRDKLEKLRLVKRHKHHPLLHHIHKAHGISRKTLFYIKEYGPHSNVARTIIKESLKILLLASLISAFGGIALEETKTLFVSLVPLVILLPALNDMIGDYGTIISSRISTMLHEGIVNAKWWKTPELRQLIAQVMIISMITAVLSAGIAIAIPIIGGSAFDGAMALKVVLITLLDVALLVSILVVLSAVFGIYFFKKEEDPNNFLIPITTSVADFGNMLLLAGLVILFF